MAEAVTAKNRPAIKPKFLSDGTLSSKNLEASRRFREKFLGRRRRP